ncbi:hypothetical protein SVAN01_00089 [Stagonosporopsis vannaccii]|nr:hypothetical protein SVAN01_00089 [Stagonosporopsis vannaccii]
MSSASFFSTRWPPSTYGPGLHNLDFHAADSALARGWSAPRAAICLQALYSRFWAQGSDVQSWLHINGDIYSLGKGIPLRNFMNEVEAKYKDVTVLVTKVDARGEISTTVLYGDCAEELVPGSQNCGSSIQFAWAFRLYFPRCRRERGIPTRILP